MQTKVNTEETLAKKRPPNLIFTETHDDPAIKIILLKMLNKLQELGYVSFYDEISKNKNADIVIKELTMVQNWFSSLTYITMEKNNGQILSYAHLKEFHKNDEEISFILKAVPGYLANLSLMKELKNTKIAYRPIDINSTDHDYKSSPEGINARDKHMGKKYLNSDSPVFGLAGVNHLNGLKEYLKESNAFEYFFIYSSSHSGLNGLEELEEYKISLTKDIPEGVHIFDIDEMGHDNTIEAIVNIILNHEEHSNHKKNLKKEKRACLLYLSCFFLTPTRKLCLLISGKQVQMLLIIYLIINTFLPLYLMLLKQF